MKKVLVSFMIALLVFGLYQAPVFAEEDRETISIDFKDTEKLEWVKDSIGRMKEKGIFQGYEDGTFKPNAPVLRMQTIITAVRLLGLEDEAKAMNPDEITLQFKDAKALPDNVKGYVAVALENGLFEMQETVVNPYKPATRLWVSGVLVRALGLEDEALASMNELPDFNDLDKIPAGAIGYVNVALEYGIFTGTLEGNFNPHKTITRAQMAAVLDRSYGNMLEENGSVTVDGQVESISFDGEDGLISVNSFTGEAQSYSINKNLLVQYDTRFMAADQIRQGDFVELYVLDNVVQEASVYTTLPDNSSSMNGIQHLKVEAENGEDEFELSYKLKKGKESAKIEIENSIEEQEYKDFEAVELISSYVKEWNLTSETTEEELTTSIIATLGFTPEELEVHVKFADGSRIKYEMDEDDKDDKEDDDGDDDLDENE
ncbi:S-layer homology domain-containing protein [Jeotgalibacillus aurantiacus]|uniref:S-layer homology domain-containing protein n=1 Tax=Jeotgalibacillus aurantiacus TaxID=2763266 RepID=UPI001D0B3A1F|nr:S-layer homology domain-containing protein [Jeotgalibacillus aurantiacus]